MSLFGFGWMKTTSSEIGQPGLASIFDLALKNDDFIRQDILSTYTMILTDTFERTQGLNDEQRMALPDSCVQNESPRGLITLLACAMTDMRDAFIVYKDNVIRKADRDEERQIRKDYKDKGESSVGIYVSFDKYARTERLRIYSALEYCILCSLNKVVNLSRAIQVQVEGLRKSVNLADAGVAAAQARAISVALGLGKGVMMDANDKIVTATPDIEPTEKAIMFLDNKKSFILSLPLSYVNGTQTGGIGSTGEADMRAIERGLKQYFTSIVEPVCKALFGKDTEFKSLDFRDLNVANETAKAMSLIDDELMPPEIKAQVIARVFDIDLDDLEQAIEDFLKEQAKKPEPKPVGVVVPAQLPNGQAAQGQGAQSVRNSV